MTTLAAIDRVVHHSVILDLMGLDSYRAEAATAHHRAPVQSGHAAPASTELVPAEAAR